MNEVRNKVVRKHIKILTVVPSDASLSFFSSNVDLQAAQSPWLPFSTGKKKQTKQKQRTPFLVSYLNHIAQDAETRKDMSEVLKEFLICVSIL